MRCSWAHGEPFGGAGEVEGGDGARQLPSSGIGGRDWAGSGGVGCGSGEQGGVEEDLGLRRGPSGGGPLSRTFFDILCDCPYEWGGSYPTPGGGGVERRPCCSTSQSRGRAQCRGGMSHVAREVEKIITPT